MNQLLVHILGDFVLQSDWMALNKSKRTIPCLVHVLIYTSCFLLLTTSWKALLVIGVTHFFIDRFHTPLKRLIWLKNHFPTGKYPPYEYCDATGHYDDSPYTTAAQRDIFAVDGMKIQNNVERVYPQWWGKPRHFFITIWIYIVIDNFLHLTINYFALKYLA